MASKEEYEYKSVPDSEEATAKYDAKGDGYVTVETPTMPVDDPTTSNRKFLYIAACIGNLIAFVSGTTLGWTSPEIPKLQLPHEAGNPLAQPLSSSDESWIGSLLPVGATLGPFLAGYLADKIGRKYSLLIGGIPFIVAFILASFASTPLMFFAVRFFFGIGTGVVFTVLPMYVGEISENEVRDTLGSFLQLFVVIGLLFSFCLGPYVSIKAFNIVCLIPPLVFLLMFYFFVPESPYYLIRTDKKEAEKSLMALRAQSREAVQTELQNIKANVEESLANRASFMDIFKSKGLTKALIISVGLVSFQQLSGINIILFYAQGIFTDAGSTIPADISTIMIGIVQVIASACTPLVVKKFGKRFLLILSAIGMAISQGVLAIFFLIKSGGGDISSISWLPIISLICYIITYCLGFGPLPWAVMGELFPGNIKSVASTATAAGCWFLGFVITKYFSLVTNLLGPGGSFGIFAGCCVLAALFVRMFLPDTSGKSLQEIQDILNGNNRKS